MHRMLTTWKMYAIIEMPHLLWWRAELKKQSAIERQTVKYGDSMSNFEKITVVFYALTIIVDLIGLIL